jgi:hypothetical protein
MTSAVKKPKNSTALAANIRNALAAELLRIITQKTTRLLFVVNVPPDAQDH